MIDGLTNADALPVLERLMQFAGRRHELIAHDIANLDTPGFRPVDVDPDAFRTQLSEAVDERRQRGGRGDLRLRDSSEVEVHADTLSLRPAPAGENLLFHDGNDRDLERTMQKLVENFMTFRMAADFMRSRFDLLNTAIRERI
ncbi:MAG: flagellar basal body rod protein FlgB [Planctomycetota bacterium]|jgi:flagellar basal-body rod protein FlgB